MMRVAEVNHHGSEAGEEGFAAVDALIALLILSTTLVLSLGGLQTAVRLSRIAAETGEATALARGVLADGIDAQGRSGDFGWTLETQAAGAGDNEAGLCQRTLLIRSLKDGRTYRFATADRCG